MPIVDLTECEEEVLKAPFHIDGGVNLKVRGLPGT